MKEQLISFETAKLAKEKGFNPIFCEFEKVPDEMFYDAYDFRKYHYSFLNGKSEKDAELVLPAVCRKKNLNYNFICYAPTQSLLQKWLREEHNIHINVSYGLTFTFKINGDLKGNDYVDYSEIEKYWGRTYEQALEKGLQKALKLIK